SLRSRRSASRTCRSASAAPAAGTAASCWPKSSRACSRRAATRPGFTIGTSNVVEPRHRRPADPGEGIAVVTTGGDPLLDLEGSLADPLPPIGPAVVALGGGHGLSI